MVLAKRCNSHSRVDPAIAIGTRLLTWAIVCLLACLLPIGWSIGHAAEAVASASAVSEPPEASTGYRVGRGDELNFRFYYTPELNTVASVRPDGRVALPLIGDLDVVGLSMPALAAKVEAALAGRVKRPQVVVNLQGGSASQRVFVGGEVGHPGAQPLLGPLTVLQAVMAAEGLKDTAQPASVVVLRANTAQANGNQAEPTLLKVDLAGLMSGQPGARDVLLAPQDVVIVPRSGVANLNLWIDQYLRRNLPINFGVNYTINQNRGYP